MEEAAGGTREGLSQGSDTSDIARGKTELRKWIGESEAVARGCGLESGKVSMALIQWGRGEGRTLERKAVNVVWDKFGLNCPRNDWEDKHRGYMRRDRACTGPRLQSACLCPGPETDATAPSRDGAHFSSIEPEAGLETHSGPSAVAEVMCRVPKAGL